MSEVQREIYRREIRDKSGRKGCALVVLSDHTLQCEFKNGKGRPAFYIPFDEVEKEAEPLKAAMQSLK